MKSVLIARFSPSLSFRLTSEVLRGDEQLQDPHAAPLLGQVQRQALCPGDHQAQLGQS